MRIQYTDVLGQVLPAIPRLSLWCGMYEYYRPAFTLERKNFSDVLDSILNRFHIFNSR